MIPTWTLIRSTHFSTFDTLIQFIHCLESGYRVIRQIHQTKILSKWWKSEHCVWSSVESFSKILIRPAWTILTDSSASHHIDQTAMFQGQAESIVVSTDHDMNYVGGLGTRDNCKHNHLGYIWYTKSCLVGHQEPFTGSELLELWTDTSVSPMTQRQLADVQREPLAAFPSQRGALYASRWEWRWWS